MVDFLWNQWIGKSTSMDPMDPVFSWGFMILGHRSREQTFSASLSSGGLLTTLLPSVAFEIAMHPKSRKFMEIYGNLLSGIEYLLKSTSANLHPLRLMNTCPQISLISTAWPSNTASPIRPPAFQRDTRELESANKCK